MISSTRGTVSAEMRKWDVSTLSWLPWDGSLSTGSITIGTVNQGTGGASAWKVDGSAVTQPVTQTRLTTLAVSGSVAGSGNNVCITPASGKKIRLFYLSYNPSGAAECAFRFGAAGTLFLRNSVGAGAVVAKDFGEFRNLEGAANESLILNLSSAVSTIWNAIYQEID
jgi:hypothetical protein